MPASIAAAAVIGVENVFTVKVKSKKKASCGVR